jgi:hypothetical protein
MVILMYQPRSEGLISQLTPTLTKAAAYDSSGAAVPKLTRLQE